MSKRKPLKTWEISGNSSGSRAGGIGIEKMNDYRFSIGEMANLCGITVRPLQYYDRSGLLHASLTEGGRRMYTRKDLLRLQQILFLKSLGFPLGEIGSKILNENSSANLEKSFTRQREILLQQMKNLQKIVDTLSIAVDDARQGREISLERLMTILEVMKEGKTYTFIVRYFSDDQLKSIAEHFERPDTYQVFADNASEMLMRLEELLRHGADPEDSEGQEHRHLAFRQHPTGRGNVSIPPVILMESHYL